MSKVITMTELLRNPKKVRALVSQKIKIYVMFEGKICMIITAPDGTKIPEEVNKKSTKIPTANLNIDVSKITRDDIYNRDSWLDKINE